MSAVLSVVAKPFITALSRLPDLNSSSCLTRYSACWPAMIGLAGLPREPSALWQAAQTLVDVAWPLARSGFAAAGAESAAAAGAASTKLSTAADSRRFGSRTAAGFIRAGCSCAKPGDFTMPDPSEPHGRTKRHHHTGRPGRREQRRRDETRARVDPHRPFRDDREPTRPVAVDRAARGRVCRPLQRRQVDRDQRAGAAEAARLRVAHAR